MVGKKKRYRSGETKSNVYRCACLLTNKECLILDIALSAVDANGTQYLAQKALAAVWYIVAHRDAGRYWWMKDALVIRYLNLLAHGWYYEQYLIQGKEEVEAKALEAMISYLRYEKREF